MSHLAQLWWSQFHGPAQFLDRFCREAALGGCFFLRHTQEIPWYFQFQELVLESLQREVGHFRQEEPEDLPEDGSPQWFVERFLPQQASNFLSTTKLSAFLAQTGGLRGRVVWLRTCDPDQLALWLEQLSQLALVIVFRAGDRLLDPAVDGQAVGPAKALDLKALVLHRLFVGAHPNVAVCHFTQPFTIF